MRRTIIFVFTICLCICLSGCQSEEEKNYRSAKDLMTSGNYSEAISVFKALGDYKDSAELLQQSKYEYAVSLAEEKQYDEAVQIWTELGDYSDSKECIEKANEDKTENAYENAIALYENGSFVEAAEAFAELSDYKETNDYLIRSSYEAGVMKYNEQLYKEAVKYFEKAGDYLDAKEYIPDAKYKYILANYDCKVQTTYQYLKDLISLNYQDSQKLYDELYAWKVNCWYSSTEKGEPQNSFAVSAGVYFNYEIVSGPYFGDNNITIKVEDYSNGLICGGIIFQNQKVGSTFSTLITFEGVNFYSVGARVIDDNSKKVLGSVTASLY